MEQPLAGSAGFGRLAMLAGFGQAARMIEEQKRAGGRVQAARFAAETLAAWDDGRARSSRSPEWGEGYVAGLRAAFGCPAIIMKGRGVGR